MHSTMEIACYSTHTVDLKNKDNTLNQGNVGVWLRHASFSPCATPEEMQEDRGQALAPLVKACTPSALGGGLIGDPHPDCLFRIPAPLIA